VSALSLLFSKHDIAAKRGEDRDDLARLPP
jgi:hypothetical protein